MGDDDDDDNDDDDDDDGDINITEVKTYLTASRCVQVQFTASPGIVVEASSRLTRQLIQELVCFTVVAVE